MIELQAPKRLTGHYNSLTKIFLGGSIEMGTAEKWQDRVKRDLEGEAVALFNPRRDDWDSSWVQRSYDPQFNEQVNWEMDHLWEADIIVFFFDPKTQSPITLLELGMFVNSIQHTVLVCCADGFWRKGNVEIVCERANRPVYNSYDELMVALKEAVAAHADLPSSQH